MGDNRPEVAAPAPAVLPRFRSRSLSSTIGPHLYLASASPRRRELLSQIGLRHVVLPQQVDETALARESPPVYVLRIAAAKARAALGDPLRRLPVPLLSADTAVVCDGEIFGKPESFTEARRMLQALAGRTHQVLTAVVVCRGDQWRETVVSTDVEFRGIAEDEIAAYWASGEPLDKAGAYAIQGLGALFVKRCIGSYSNVVGLPLFETAELLQDFGITVTSLLASRP